MSRLYAPPRIHQDWVTPARTLTVGPYVAGSEDREPQVTFVASDGLDIYVPFPKSDGSGETFAQYQNGTALTKVRIIENNMADDMEIAVALIAQTGGLACTVSGLSAVETVAPGQIGVFQFGAVQAPWVTANRIYARFQFTPGREQVVQGSITAEFAVILAAAGPVVAQPIP